MQEQTSRQQIEQLWECSIERAQMDTQQDAPLATNLNTAAGLHIQSGTRAGGSWTGTGSSTCGADCTMQC